MSVPTPQNLVPTSRRAVRRRRISLLVALSLALSLVALFIARRTLEHDTTVGKLLQVPPRWHDRTLPEWLDQLRHGNVNAAHNLSAMLSEPYPFAMNCPGPLPPEPRIGITDHPEIVPALLEALDSSIPQMRAAAARTVSCCGPYAAAAVPQLLRLLADDEVAFDACAALGSMGPAAAPALADLRKLYAHARPDFRYVAAKAIWQIDESPDSLDVCGALLAKNNVRDRATIAGFLARDVGPSAAPLMPVLLRLTATELAPTNRDHNIAPLRTEVIRLLGSIGPPAADAVPFLIAVFQDDESQRRNCMWALSLIGPKAAPAVEPVRAWLHKVMTKQIVPPSRGSLIYEQFAAYRLYAAVGPGAAAAVPDLVAVIDVPKIDFDNMTITGVAADTLGRIGPSARASLPHLKRMLAHDQAGPHAALAIWLIEPDAAGLARVEDLIEHGPHYESQHAQFLKTVGEAGPAAAAALPAVLRVVHGDRWDTIAAAETAWKIGAAPEAMTYLEQVLAKNDKRSIYAALAIARINNDPAARRMIIAARCDLQRRDALPNKWQGDRAGRHRAMERN